MVDCTVQRLSFFQESLNQLPSIDTLEYSDILTIVHAYLARNDAEIEELATSRRHGRPPSKRETELKQQKADEERQLQSGFWAPDLRDKDTVEKLRGWKGEWVALGQMKFVRVDGDGKIREGEWPPGKG